MNSLEFHNRSTYTLGRHEHERIFPGVGLLTAVVRNHEYWPDGSMMKLAITLGVDDDDHAIAGETFIPANKLEAAEAYIAGYLNGREAGENDIAVEDAAEIVASFAAMYAIGENSNYE